jgi:hypothetical protein
MALSVLPREFISESVRSLIPPGVKDLELLRVGLSQAQADHREVRRRYRMDMARTFPFRCRSCPEPSRAAESRRPGAIAGCPLAVRLGNQAAAAQASGGKEADPWAPSAPGGYSDEPPF